MGDQLLNWTEHPSPSYRGIHNIPNNIVIILGLEPAGHQGMFTAPEGVVYVWWLLVAEYEGLMIKIVRGKKCTFIYIVAIVHMCSNYNMHSHRCMYAFICMSTKSC